jgi:hypothetical protein
VLGVTYGLLIAWVPDKEPEQPTPQT